MKTISGTVNTAQGAVTLIDAHHHLWDLSMDRHPWLGSQPEKQFFLGDYSPIKKNYLPADYLKDSAGHNVLATVHCEAEWDRADQVGETRWISAIHARHGFPNAIIAAAGGLSLGARHPVQARHHRRAIAKARRRARHHARRQMARGPCTPGTLQPVL